MKNIQRIIWPTKPKILRSLAHKTQNTSLQFADLFQGLAIFCSVNVKIIFQVLQTIQSLATIQLFGSKKAKFISKLIWLYSSKTLFTKTRRGTRFGLGSYFPNTGLYDYLLIYFSEIQTPTLVINLSISISFNLLHIYILNQLLSK